MKVREYLNLVKYLDSKNRNELKRFILKPIFDISAIKKKMIGYLHETREKMDQLFEDGKQYSRDIYMFYAGIHEFCVWVIDCENEYE